MQQVDDPPFIAVGTEVSAKYKGAFCEAKVSKVVRNIKVRVAYKQGLGTGIVSDDAIKASAGQLRVGAVVEVRHPDRKEYIDATITKIQDSSQYTVVFDDGDITTLRRSALCMKSGRHFNESETLDQLPLTHPEHFGNPVVGGRRGRRRAQLNGDSSEEDEESDAKEVVEKEEDIGKVILFEPETKKKEKEKWFPGLVVSPTAQATERIRVKDEYLVRSFKDGRYYTVPKKEAVEFPRPFSGSQQNSPAFQAALRYLDSNVLPPHWDRDTLFAISNSSSCEEVDIDSDSSEDEPSEEKDRFVAQLYKFMDDRGTPLNKSPSIHNRDIDLYRLFRAVQKRGGYNRVSSKNQWKHIVVRLGFAPVSQSVKNLVKQAYKKFLQPYCEFNRKLGCSLLMPSSRTGRGKGRSLVRANSVASPKTVDANNTKGPSSNTPSSTPPVTALALASTAGQQSGTEESGNLSESSVDTLKNKKKATKTKPVAVKEIATEVVIKKEPVAAPVVAKEDSPPVEIKSESIEHIKDEGDIPLSKIKAAAATASANAAASIVAATAVVMASAPATPSSSVASNPPASGSSSTSSRSSEESKEIKEVKEVKEVKEIKPSNKESKESKEVKENKEIKEKKHSSSYKEEKSKNEPPTRDSSPSDRSAKKDKHQRKQTPQSDDKRSKRRRDEISVERYGTGDSLIEVNDKLQVYYHEKKTYECKVLEITLQRSTPMYLVHYTGWNTRYDEWVPFERIAENITKGTKFKTRFSSNSDKNKDKDKDKSHSSSSHNNSAGNVSTSSGSGSSSHGGSNNSSHNNLGNMKPSTSTSSSSSSSTADPSKSQNNLVKRGRGRSDSFPPRSTTPSSGASNSSRTKSPANSSSLKKRQARASSSASRKNTASANASDVSMLSDDTDSDSDEPVRRPKRKPKDSSFKSKSSSSKSANKSKQNSANNSATDSENDDDDEEGTSSSIRTLSRSASDIGSKGRDYDLNQIRMELKGFRDLKTPPAPNTPSTIDSNTSIDEKDIKIKTELDFDDVRSISSTETKATTKTELKEELTDSSTGMDSLVDDDSQSSDKTTTLKNMTKKFQHKINVEKQKAMEKPKSSSNVSSGMFGSNERSSASSNVEKILKDSQAETKRHENLKSKGLMEENKSKKNREAESPYKSSYDSSRKHHHDSKDEEKKFSNSSTSEAKVSSGFQGSSKNPNTSGNSSSSGSKFSSSHAEKSPVIKKSSLDPGKTKKSVESGQSKGSCDTAAKKLSESALSQKELVKTESQPAGSPCSSTSSSSSSSFGTSSSVHSARSLPDMSKLEISGSSSSSPCHSVYAPMGKESKYSPPKAISPDIYEFKDPEPFEYEVRKSPMVSSNISHNSHSSTSTSTLAQSSAVSHVRNNSPATSTRKLSTTKATSNTHNSNLTESAAALSASVLKGPKKRGSPFKETTSLEKSKHSKGEEKVSPLSTPNSTTSTSILADAKLIHNPTHSAPETPKTTKTSPHTNKATGSTVQPDHPVVAAKNTTPVAPSTAAPPSTIPTTATQSQPSSSTTGSAGTSHQKNKDSTTTSASTTSVASTSSSSVSAFDALRKSGSTNVNMNALNEELATAKKAFTDVLITKPTSPSVLDSPSIKTEPITPVKATKETSVPNVTAAASTPATQTTTSSVSTPVTASTSASMASALSPQPSTSAAAALKMAVTPPQPIVNKPLIGSPFLETRKDLSNVFELTCNENSSGSFKDQKFEFENAKILLSSSSGGAFDLDPALYEKKSTSIADKVLKAISQKKEVENKQKEALMKLEMEKEKERERNPEFDKEEQPSTSSNQPTILKDLGSLSMPFSSDPFSLSSLQTMEPLKINTDLISSIACMPSSLSAELSKRMSLSSPDCKTLLDGKPIQKNDLSETIQKLESAIQRKTPITVLSNSAATTPTPTSMPTMDTFSDDSTDSTDSERRLVIEDIGEEQHDSQKSPIIAQSDSSSGPGLSMKLDTTEKAKIITSNIVPTQQSIQTPIPLKLSVTPQKSPLLYPGQPMQGVSVTSPSGPASLTKSPLKNSPNMSSTSVNVSLISPQQMPMANLKGLPTPMSLQFMPGAINSIGGASSSSAANTLMSVVPSAYNEGKKDPKDSTNLQLATSSAASISLLTQAGTPHQRNEIVVTPITGDMSGAIPLASDPTMVMKITKNHQQTPMPQGPGSLASMGGTSVLKSVGTVNPLLHNTSHLQQQYPVSTANRVSGPEPIQQVVIPKAGLQATQSAPGPSTSGFYLNAHKELRPEDGLTPLQAQTPPMQDKPRAVPVLPGGTDALASNKLHSSQSDSLNLLCEESIPGSPPPMSTNDDDPNTDPTKAATKTPTAQPDTLPATIQTQRNTNENKQEISSLQTSVITTPSCNAASGPSVITANPSAALTHTTPTTHTILLQSSSPNDSASQDESSEDLKKAMDIENDISPRKRRRTRKQSDVLMIGEQSSKKRKQHISSIKKNTAGSDSEDNVEVTAASHRSNNARQILQPQQLQPQQIMQHHQSFTGIRPCPYNFLVQLDSSLPPEQSIEIIQKQMNEIRKTYNMLKNNLASIDRRRKKYRRREREKKQMQMQQQNHQIKISS